MDSGAKQEAMGKKLARERERERRRRIQREGVGADKDEKIFSSASLHRPTRLFVTNAPNNQLK